jgi:hypothetical protein
VGGLVIGDRVRPCQVCCSDVSNDIFDIVGLASFDHVDEGNDVLSVCFSKAFPYEDAA